MGRKRVPPPDRKRLLELFEYIPESGEFLYRMTRGRMMAGDRAGTKNTLGYWQVTIDRQRYPAAHLAWFYVYGIWPSETIDHENLERGDNAIVNLREATFSQNSANRGVNKNNKSGEKGVHWCTPKDQKGVWKAKIVKDGKVIHLGHFDKKEDAAAAYKIAAMKHFGEFARF